MQKLSLGIIACGLLAVTACSKPSKTNKREGAQSSQLQPVTYCDDPTTNPNKPVALAGTTPPGGKVPDCVPPGGKTPPGTKVPPGTTPPGGGKFPGQNGGGQFPGQNGGGKVPSQNGGKVPSQNGGKVPNQNGGNCPSQNGGKTPCLDPNNPPVT